MPGPNFVLDKGFLVNSNQTALAFGEIVVADSTGTAINRALTAQSTGILGVAQEAIDQVKVSTGKAVADVRLLGIAKVIANGAISVGQPVTNDVNARAVAAVQTTAGQQPKQILGFAMSAAVSPGDWINVMLTPGSVY